MNRENRELASLKTGAGLTNPPFGAK
jgi:hypothetical protein